MANTSDGLLIAIYTLVTSAFITYWIPEYVYAHKLFMHPSFTNPDTSQKYLHTGISEISFAVMIHNIFPFLTAITTLQLEENQIIYWQKSAAAIMLFMTEIFCCSLK